MKHNAISAAGKLQRRADFLAAARRLFIQQQRLPVVADIAADGAVVVLTGTVLGIAFHHVVSHQAILGGIGRGDDRGVGAGARGPRSVGVAHEEDGRRAGVRNGMILGDRDRIECVR